VIILERSHLAFQGVPNSTTWNRAPAFRRVDMGRRNAEGRLEMSMPSVGSGATFALIVALALTLAHASGATRKRNETPQNHDKTVHRLVIQVDQDDPAVMNMALNNAANVVEYYRGRGERADIDIVAYGPGLNMLRADTSPVADRIRSMKDTAFPGTVRFSACNVTKERMEKKEGKTLAMLPESSIVASGVVHMMELQEKGWSYVRP
jgi:intracellular sulfur oxidation DsrE/DsrF family protein